jgi:hypothetical protein
MAESHLHDHAPHLSATEARQAVRGQHVFWMLAASLTLAIVALAASWAYRSHDLSAADAANGQRAPAAATARPHADPNNPSQL